MIEATVGIAFGVATILFARFARIERWFYSAGLIGLPLIYVAFAMYRSDGSAAAQELLWGIPFFVAGILLSVFNPRSALVLIGGFWLVHGGYDWVHEYLFDNPGVPSWYPVFCAAVDVVIGVYLLVLSSKVSSLKARHA